MNEVMIAATTIPVVIEITARPGDLLLLVNGVCIGVQPRRAIALIEGRVQQPTRHDPVAKINGGGKKPTARQKSREEANVKLLAMIGKGPPRNTARLLDAMNIDPKDNKRKYLMQRLNYLADTGVIARHPDDTHARRPRWVLPKS